MPFSPWGVLATWLYIGAKKNTRKMNLQLILNKNSSWAHTELKFDVLGVAGKLVKYIHSSKNKRLENYFSSHIVPKQKTTSFLSQEILRVNMKNEHLDCLLQIAKNSKQMPWLR
jgi:hypothetical protein